MANNEILKLTKSFALRIIRMVEFLFKNYPHNRVVDVLGKQVMHLTQYTMIMRKSVLF